MAKDHTTLYWVARDVTKAMVVGNNNNNNPKL